MIMKHEKRVKFLKGLLNIIGSFMILTIVLLTLAFMTIKDIRSIFHPIVAYILIVTLLGSYLVIIVSLKRILNSILYKNPFVLDNVTIFKRIGFSILIVGLSDAIANYPAPNFTGIDLIATSNGSLKPIFFLYIILSLLAFILADVFRIAIEIKDENDLTI